jgi:hypothetical protein
VGMPVRLAMSWGLPNWMDSGFCRLAGATRSGRAIRWRLHPGLTPAWSSGAQTDRQIPPPNPHPPSPFRLPRADRRSIDFAQPVLQRRGIGYSARQRPGLIAAEVYQDRIHAIPAGAGQHADKTCLHCRWAYSDADSSRLSWVSMEQT